ncbi:MAG: metallophosphoesterase family protein [Parabacteroides sp.]
MDRRLFFKSLGCTGALIATSRLPVMAQDDPSVFSNRGGYERLVLGYAVINIGLEEPFSVLHISDTHLTAAYDHEDPKKQELRKSRTVTFGGRQEEALRDSLAWAKEHVDYVIHTGDLIDWQSEANFDLVKRYFGEAMTGALGNHEYSTDMWLSEPKESRDEAYKNNTKAKIQQVYPFDVMFHSQVVNGVNFITLDDVYGYVVPEQVERFKQEVRKGLPIILCMHVPFVTENIWRAICKFWRGASRFRDRVVPPPTDDYQTQLEDPVTRDFIAYLKQEPLLKGILAGHEHFTMQDRFSPTAMQYIVGGNFLFHGEEILFL